MIITIPEGQTNCQSCGKPWKDHSRRQIKECGICGMCHRVLKEHSADEHKTCDAAHEAEIDATPCEACGKLQKEHSQEQSMECLEKCREQRQRDKEGIKFLRKLSKELPGDDENISKDAAVVLVRDRWTDGDTEKCGERCRLLFFAWARQIERRGKPYDEKEADKEVCLYCNRLVQEHTRDQIQECGNESDGLAFDNYYYKESEEKSEELQAVSAFHNAQVCTCGKKRGEHTLKEEKACRRNSAHNYACSRRGIVDRRLMYPVQRIADFHQKKFAQWSTTMWNSSGKTESLSK